MTLKLPPSLHEGMVEQFAKRDRHTGRIVDDEYIGGLSRAVKLARESADALANLEQAALADSTQTREAALLQVSGAALKSGERVAKALDAARGRVQAEIALIDRQTGTPPPPKDAVEVSLESDIRNRLSQMPTKERDDVLSEALATNNAMILGAVLRGPAMLSGLTNTRMDILRARYRKQFHAEATARREALAKALEATNRAGNLFVGLIKQATEEPAVQLAAAAVKARKAAEQVHAQASGAAQ
jgi:hypothetical protein